MTANKVTECLNKVPLPASSIKASNTGPGPGKTCSSTPVTETTVSHIIKTNMIEKKGSNLL